MACTAAELAALTPALNGIPLGLVPYAELAILCQILQASDPMADCSASAMVENAKCLACSIPPGLVQFASLYLLCQILDTGGGGGAGTDYQLEGHGPPVADPADTTKIWTYFDLDDGRQEYVWSVEEQSW